MLNCSFCIALLHLFNQLVVVLFDLNADGHLRELPEHVLQQGKLPVCTAAVATCSRDVWQLRLRLLH